MDSLFLCITLLLSMAEHGRLQKVNCPTGCNCTSLSISCCGSQKRVLLPFTGLDKTTKLSLMDCQPLDIYEKSFQSMKSLEEITITRSPVTFIDSGAFAGFQELKNLSLTQLNLSAANMHPLVFNNLSVELIDLRDNNLSLVTRQMFRGLKYLRVLDLSRNKIGLIQNWAFESLSQLSFLSLDFNSLKTVTPYWFLAYGNYSSLLISIAGNNLTDECRYRGVDLAENKWFTNSIIPNNSLSFARSSAPPCSAPMFNNPYQEIYLKESASVTLTCSVNSIPKSLFSWLLPTGLAVSSNGTLNLTNIQVSSTGTYACVASNSEGSAVAVTRILVISTTTTINSSSSATSKASMVLLIVFIAIILLIVCFVVVYILKSVYKLAKKKADSGFEFRQFVDTPNILPVPENPQPMPQL